MRLPWDHLKHHPSRQRFRTRGDESLVTITAYQGWRWYRCSPIVATVLYVYNNRNMVERRKTRVARQRHTDASKSNDLVQDRRSTISIKKMRGREQEKKPKRADGMWAHLRNNCGDKKRQKRPLHRWQHHVRCLSTIRQQHLLLPVVDADGEGGYFLLVFFFHKMIIITQTTHKKIYYLVC